MHVAPLIFSSTLMILVVTVSVIFDILELLFKNIACDGGVLSILYFVFEFDGHFGFSPYMKSIRKRAPISAAFSLMSR